MTQILVIYTGGTIGMVPSSRGLIPDANFPQCLRSALQQPDLAITAISPLIDSSSATPDNWQTIADAITAAQRDYDGFVVLHGTDTLAYTAAAITLMLQGLGKPVIITGSQYPLGEEGSDASNNVRGALTAAQMQEGGVSVFFHNVLLRGDAVRKVHAQAFAAFTSGDAAPLAHWLNGELQWHSQPTISNKTSAYLQGNWRGFQRGAVAMLYVYPDMPESAFLPVLTDPEIKGVVLCSFGSGNLPERDDLHSAIRNAVARGVRIINTTQCLGGEVRQDTYAAGAGALGVENGAALTPEMVFVTLHYALAMSV
ncbi:asparaginase [Cardiobacteriaceae bacterium TAE3-ERU3]|nr:asparaginase [Cardiobacteriaceae bacterium TAE3-ERU3]